MTSPTRLPAPSFLPATAVLEMTYRCNHACRFCSCPWFAPEGDFDILPELDIHRWKALVEKLCAMGAFNIAFTGGEPLLKEGITELIEHAAHLDVERIETEEGVLVSRVGPPTLYLLTNGKAMTEEVLALCARHDIRLSMSLPGLTTFGEHTGGGDPENVLHWFSRAKEAGVSTTVGVTVTRRNLFELYETIAAAFLAGADQLLMNRFLPGGRGLCHASELALSRDDVRVMLDTAESVLRESRRWGSVGTELPKCMVDESRYERLEVGTRCSAALDFMVVGPSGHVRVCNHSPSRLVHVDALESLKHHPYWKRFIAKEYLPKQCEPCDLMTVCDGGCREAAHVITGEVDGVDPLLEDGDVPFRRMDETG